MATQIDAKAVQALRQETGAGMMDCKKALLEANGDKEKAIEILRKKGIARAERREGRSASEGRLQSYIHHDGKKAALVELRCETDFVANTAEFRGLLDDLCLHIVGTHITPVAVRREEVDPALVEKERAILMESEDVLKKPENLRPRIVEGRLGKFYEERVLLEQPFVKDDKKKVSDVITAVGAKLGEKIELGRFVYMRLGE